MAAGAALALALWLLLPPMGVEGAGPPPIQDGEFTFLLPAGRKQCFYQSAPANASLETEYQVESPESGSRRASGARARGRGQAPEARHGLKREGEEPVRQSAGAELGRARWNLWGRRGSGGGGVSEAAGGGGAIGCRRAPLTGREPRGWAWPRAPPERAWWSTGGFPGDWVTESRALSPHLGCKRRSRT